ncbi:MAG: zinc-dependent dehydrogenase [Candidatus Omnitrophica bacterium]|nr:zinc-dependent dehydrogenase [Candidatus Omnitrophota bacterium]
MRVAMYYANNDVRLEEAPLPEIGPDELLMRVEASGICGSDVMEWYRIGRVPLVLGHEVSGVVEDAGKNVKGYKKGDRIAAAHHVPCLSCRYCLSGHPTACETLRKTNFYPGGFSEYIRLPSINVKRGVFLLPGNVSYEEATFIEPLACVLRGQRIAGVGKDDTVLVIGSGISGILHVHLARSSGASNIIATDIAESRLKLAKRFGADEALDAGKDVPKLVSEFTGGMGVDIVIITTGATPAIEQALKSVRRGGTVLFFAAADKDIRIPISINDIFWRTEVTLTSSYAGSPEDHKEALKLISSKKVNVRDMITHRLPLAETQKGFQLVANAKDSLKVIIEPQK